MSGELTQQAGEEGDRVESLNKCVNKSVFVFLKAM